MTPFIIGAIIGLPTAIYGMNQGMIGRCASRRSAALRAEPVALSQAKPAAAIAGGFDTSRGADNILPLLNADQREFILRMKPHTRDQRISVKDWDTVDPKVDNPDEDGWPYWHWFGGMTAKTGAGQKGWTRTFRFSPDGLAVRTALAGEAGTAETPKRDSVHEHAAAKPRRPMLSPWLKCLIVAASLSVAVVSALWIVGGVL